MKKAVSAFLATFGMLIIGLVLSMSTSVNTTIAQEDATPLPTPTVHDHEGETDNHSHADGMDGEVTSDVIETGHSIYLEKGCNACHGPNGEGNSAGPALAGHSREDVYRQLRSPTGIMPVYGSDIINFREAEFLVAYIVNLPMSEMMDMNADHEHNHVGFRLSHVIVNQHWYALYELQEGNVNEAIHHLDHIIEFTEGSHQLAMLDILEQVNNDNLESAQANIEDMLFGIIEPEAMQHENYIRFASVMLELERPTFGVHYLEHASELLPVDDGLQDSIDELIALVESEDISEASERIQTVVMDLDISSMDMDDMDDHSSDEHMHSGLTSIDDLIAALEDAGASASRAESFSQPFFNVDAQVVMINDSQALQVFEYRDEMGAMEEVELVDPSGSPIGESQMAWMMPPHFYHSGHLIVIYVGNDTDTLDLLTTILGEQFAGQ